MVNGNGNSSGNSNGIAMIIAMLCWWWWLVCWFVCWLVGRLAGWFVGWLVGGCGATHPPTEKFKNHGKINVFNENRALARARSKFSQQPLDEPQHMSKTPGENCISEEKMSSCSGGEHN